MNNAVLVRELHFLGIDQDTWPVLALLPLLQVAWADGIIQPEERALIQRIANEQYHLSDEAKRILENWLQHAPTEQYLRRGSEAFALLAMEFPDLSDVDGVIAHAEAVARAAGGLFGFGAIDTREKSVISEIANALSLPPTMRWEWAQDLTEDASNREDADGPLLTYQPLEAGGSAVLIPDFDPTQVYGIPASGLAIGRARSNDVLIQFDPQISRRHAKIQPTATGFEVLDNQSTAGTYVNGERVQQRRLFGGETLRVGETSFHFELATAP